MTFVTFTNILVMLLCIAVVVQSVRILRSFRSFSEGDLRTTVIALDKATAQARAVLSELRDTLRTDCADTVRTLAEGDKLREELTVMIGIANAVAERIITTVEDQAKPAAEPTATPPRKRHAAVKATVKRPIKRRAGVALATAEGAL